MLDVLKPQALLEFSEAKHVGIKKFLGPRKNNRIVKS